VSDKGVIESTSGGLRGSVNKKEPPAKPLEIQGIGGRRGA
jgi:hypothetical protein